MELSPSWEADNWAATKKYPNILWNLKVYYRVHKIPPMVPNPESDQSSPYPHILSKIQFNIIHHLRLGLLTGLSLSDFSTIILYAFIFFLMHSCIIVLMLFDFLKSSFL
jgi:hypothetical protein